MDPATARADDLRKQISDCETRLRDLHRELVEAEEAAAEQVDPARNGETPTANARAHNPDAPLADPQSSSDKADNHWRWPLKAEEYKRYGQQLILPEVGLQGQLRLKSCSILIVGLGGLGCPAAAYLAGAGVGTLGLMDGDVVELSNLHRQILHSVPKLGMSKVDSAIEFIQSLNPNVRCIPHRDHLQSSTALETMRPYDVVLDCTDNPATRYLISDACVLLGTPLISASALRTDGQLMVLNWFPAPPGEASGGPCYRCVFPRPPPPETVVSCGEGGVLGPAVGAMGILQALEAIKIVTEGFIGPGPECSNEDTEDEDSAPGGWQICYSPDEGPPKPSMLIFSAYSNPPFRSIRLRSRRPDCAACSATATVTEEALTSGSMDYVQFCGTVSPVDVLKPEERISATDFARLEAEKRPGAESYRVIDVQELVQFELGPCIGTPCVNIPYSEISSTKIPSSTSDAEDSNSGWRDKRPWWKTVGDYPHELPLYVVCRRGNDSQLAVRKMKELGLDHGGKRWIGDIVGGLQSWRETVDPSIPDY